MDSLSTLERDRPVEITPAMIEAGTIELLGRTYGESLQEIVHDIFIAMQCASDQPARSPRVVILQDSLAI